MLRRVWIRRFIALSVLCGVWVGGVFIAFSYQLDMLAGVHTAQLCGRNSTFLHIPSGSFVGNDDNRSIEYTSSTPSHFTNVVDDARSAAKIALFCSHV